MDRTVLAEALGVLLPAAQRFGRDAAAERDWRPDAPEAYCGRCGVTVGPGAATASGCPLCRDGRLPWDRIVRLGPYRDPLDGWVRQMKFQRGWPWGRWFGTQLALACDVPEAAPLVTPTPLHWRRRWRRGYDQARLIAEALAERRGWHLAPLLRRVRPTRPQSKMTSHAAHAANVRNAFAIDAVDLSGRAVVLVDDVKTSGQTAGACAKLVRRAGAAQIILAVVAVADPRGPWQLGPPTDTPIEAQRPA